MGEVNVTVNGRLFRLGCDDGEEEHLLVLADHLGKHVDNLRQTIGQAGDEQLYLMAGLMVCDELWEARDLLIKTREMLKSQAAEKETEPVSTSKAPVPETPARQAAIAPVTSAAPSAAPSARPSPLAAPASAITPRSAPQLNREHDKT